MMRFLVFAALALVQFTVNARVDGNVVHSETAALSATLNDAIVESSWASWIKRPQPHGQIAIESGSNLDLDTVSLCLGQNTSLSLEFLGPSPMNVGSELDLAGDCYLSEETVTFLGGTSLAIYECTFVAESPGVSTIVIEATDGNGTMSNEIVFINVLDIVPPAIEVASETGQFQVCADSVLDVTAISVNGQEPVSTWSWNLQEDLWNENEATVPQSGIFEVSGQTSSGCVVSQPFEVSPSPSASLFIAGASQVLCEGDSAFVQVVSLEEQEFTGYAWEGNWNGGGGQVLAAQGAEAWLTAGAYQVSFVDDGGCPSSETLVLAESTPVTAFTNQNLCWDGSGEVSLEFGEGHASPSEGNLQIQMISSSSLGWGEAFLQVIVTHEDGTQDISILECDDDFESYNQDTNPELALMYGDWVQVTFFGTGDPALDASFAVNLFNCVNNCNGDNAANCNSFNNLTSGQILYLGPAGCTSTTEGVWTEVSNQGNNAFSLTDQFNTTWSAYQPGNYGLCFEDFQCGVTNCFEVTVEEPEAGFDCDGNSLCGTPSVSSLTVEVTENVLDDLDLYKLYVDLPPNTNWYVSAVAGDQNISSLNPLRVTTLLSAPDGVFNTPLNSSWNASGVASAFVGVFPELAFDSYATIGLSGPASESLLANATDPGFSGSSQTTTSFLNFFNNSGEGELVMEDGVWFITPTNANQGMGDENGRCLIGQLCSSGSIDGQIVVQILESDLSGSTITDGGEMARFSFNGSGTFEGVSVNTYYPYGGGLEALKNVPICGCDDPNATNYFSWVELGIDTCEYDCNDEDEDGICDEVDECVGEYDSCGVCNGAGEVLACGCANIPVGDCDCEEVNLMLWVFVVEVV